MDIKGRLDVLMQAYYFMDRHAEELSDTDRAKLRVLEGQIETLQWCLEDDKQNWRSLWKRFWRRIRDALDRMRGLWAKDKNR